LHCNENVHTHFVFDLNVHTPLTWGINLPDILASLASLPSDSGPPVTPVRFKCRERQPETSTTEQVKDVDEMGVQTHDSDDTK
jgi:hypothetical protein